MLHVQTVTSVIRIAIRTTTNVDRQRARITGWVILTATEQCIRNHAPREANATQAAALLTIRALPIAHLVRVAHPYNMLGATITTTQTLAIT